MKSRRKAQSPKRKTQGLKLNRPLEILSRRQSLIRRSECKRPSLGTLWPKAVPVPGKSRPSTITNRKSTIAIMTVDESVTCPFCGQASELLIDTSIAQQRFVTDCEVCCRPFEVVAEGEPGEVLSLDVRGAG